MYSNCFSHCTISPAPILFFSSGSWQDLCSEIAIVPTWKCSILASGKQRSEMLLTAMVHQTAFPIPQLRNTQPNCQQWQDSETLLFINPYNFSVDMQGSVFSFVFPLLPTFSGSYLLQQLYFTQSTVCISINQRQQQWQSSSYSPTPFVFCKEYLENLDISN